VVGRRGTAAGAASRGDGRWFVVQEGGTRWRDACGSDGELIVGPGVALHGGSVVAEQGGIVGATDGRKKGYKWGVGCHTPFRDSGNEASIRVPRMFHSHV
jgi:hypothetical protein